MYVHGPRVARIIVPPHQIQQVFPAVHLVRVHGEELEHVKFFRGQVDFPFPDKHAPALAVNLHVSLHQRPAHMAFFLFRRPAHDGLDARLHFQDVERFRDIIVRAVLQSEYLVHVVIFRRQHHHRHVRELPNLLAHLEPVQLRQHHVQKHQIVLLVPGVLQGLLPVVRAVHLHVVLLQAETDSLYNQFFIVYH